MHKLGFVDRGVGCITRVPEYVNVVVPALQHDELKAAGANLE